MGGWGKGNKLMRSSKPRQMYTTTTKYSTNPPCFSHALGPSSCSPLLLLKLLLDTLALSSTSLKSAPDAPALAASAHATTPASSSSSAFLPPMPFRNLTIRPLFFSRLLCQRPFVHSFHTTVGFSPFHMKFHPSMNFILHFTLRDIFVFQPLTSLVTSLFSLLSFLSFFPFVVVFFLFSLSLSQCVDSELGIPHHRGEWVCLF